MAEFFGLIVLTAALAAGELYAYFSRKSWLLFSIALGSLVFGSCIMAVAITTPVVRVVGGAGMAARHAKFNRETAIAVCAALAGLAGLVGAVTVEMQAEIRKRSAKLRGSSGPE
ncbi:MAG: hypothetical protein ACREQI_13710 [Candidatus Binataceae bacterium]